MLDGTHITNMRTGAQTAVALKYLYPERKSITLGLFGAGVQGRTQTEAIAEVFSIDELRVYDLYPEAAERFRREMEPRVTGKITVCARPEEAAVGDAVITVTHAKDGFFRKEWFAPGTVLFPMGSYKECRDEALLSADYIVVDHIAQCLHRGALKELAEAGKITENSIDATLGELAAGTKKITASPGSRILCIPIGTGAMDVAVASVVLQRAEERNIDQCFDFAR